jgi:hypothetical protein
MRVCRRYAHQVVLMGARESALHDVRVAAHNHAVHAVMDVGKRLEESRVDGAHTLLIARARDGVREPHIVREQALDRFDVMLVGAPASSPGGLIVRTRNRSRNNWTTATL